MHAIELKEATTRLAELINKVADGEEVVITRNDGETFKIVPVAEGKLRPKFGSAKGLIEISEDFDHPLEDFEEYEP